MYISCIIFFLKEPGNISNVNYKCYILKNDSAGSKVYLIHMNLIETLFLQRTGPEVIKKLSCSTQLSMKFFLLKNVKMPTIVGILTFRSGKNSILGLSEPKKGRIS